MRSDVSQYELIAPASLDGVLQTLAGGDRALIAGGTELMVALGTGRLQAKSLVSIQHLKELRFIRVEDGVVHFGSGTTFSDIRRSKTVAELLPLMAESASWTGSVANQNRGTLGGNICNASPAADNPPVLLVYGATLTLVSAAGTRTVPYSEFHLGYKKTVLRPDELLHTISVSTEFAGYKPYLRKVGTRNAQAISKIALAGLAKTDGDVIADIRLGAASLTDRPVRCVAAEATLIGKTVTEATIREARAALAGETHAIDDIRSTAKYRSHVAGNLLEEFLRSLAG